MMTIRGHTLLEETLVYSLKDSEAFSSQRELQRAMKYSNNHH